MTTNASETTAAARSTERHRLPALLARATVRSAALRTGIVFGTAGATFVVANLILAGFLPPDDYGTLALVIAIVSLAGPIAPLGLPTIVLRERLPPHPRLVRQCLATSSIFATLTATAVALLYDLRVTELAVVVVTVVSGGLVRLGAAVLQSRERLVASTLLTESANPILLLAALAVVLVDSETAFWPLLFLAVAQLALAIALWFRLLAGRTGDGCAGHPYHLAEALLLAGTSAAALIKLQLERLMIPMLLDLGTLASYAVLAAVAVAPFRVVQVGLFRTLVPRLCTAAGPAERRRLVRQQAAETAVLIVGIGVVLALAIPPLLGFLFPAKFHLSAGLVLAAVAAGQARVLSTFTGAVIAALGDTSDLARWNGIAWFAVLTASAGGAVGAGWGLVGFLWGVVIGGAVEIVLSLPLVARRIRG